MFKFTCMVLCAVAMSLISIYADESSGPYHENVNTILLECANEYGVTDANMQAVMAAQDVTIVNTCFWGCALKKAGFLNDKGEYDLNNGLIYVRQFILNEQENAMLIDIAKQCESVKDKAVNDAQAGCERGALIAACFMQQVEAHKKQDLR